VRERGKGAWLLLMSVCVASAPSVAAQDDGPRLENPYALKKKKPAVKVKVDGQLVRALNEKIAECYAKEQDKPLSDEHKALLREYGPQVAQDLGDALAALGCAFDQRASKKCLSLLEDLSCETLAAPIIAEGWDRNITPEARAQVQEYAGMLSRREARCEGRDQEEAAIVTGVRGDRLAALIESQIVIGQCELSGDKLPDCETVLQDVTCGQIVTLNEQGKLQQVCPIVFKCIETPPPDEAKK
jgi:hypothetical protein